MISFNLNTYVALFFAVIEDVKLIMHVVLYTHLFSFTVTKGFAS